MNLLDNFHMLFFLKVSQTATLSKSSVLWFIFNGAREDSAKFKRKWEIFFKKSFQKVKVFCFFFSFYSSNLGTFYYTTLISLIPLLNCVYNYLDRNWFLAISLGRMSWHLQFWFSLASETQNVPYEPHVLVISSYIFYFGNLPHYQHHIGPFYRWQHVNCDWWARNGKHCERLGNTLYSRGCTVNLQRFMSLLYWYSSYGPVIWGHTRTFYSKV